MVHVRCTLPQIFSHFSPHQELYCCVFQSLQSNIFRLRAMSFGSGTPTSRRWIHSLDGWCIWRRWHGCQPEKILVNFVTIKASNFCSCPLAERSVSCGDDDNVCRRNTSRREKMWLLLHTRNQQKQELDLTMLVTSCFRRWVGKKEWVWENQTRVVRLSSRFVLHIFP